jgi:hypothetical protein
MSAEERDARLIVLDDGVTAATVSHTMADLGWVLWLDTPSEHMGNRMLGWAPSLMDDLTQPVDGPLVYLREQHQTGVRAMIVTGDVLGEVERALSAKLPHSDEESLLADAAGADNPLVLVRAAHRLATVATPVPGWFAWREADDRYLTAWRRLLAHPHLVVRRVALSEAELLPWREIDDLLRERQPIEHELARTLADVVQRRHQRTAAT